MQGLAYRVGRFTLEARRQLLDGDIPVAVGRKPLEVLSVLAEAQGRLVTKDELMAAVWPNLIVEENAVQAQIAALRRILGSDAELLGTVRGYGYRLDAVPEGLAPPAAEPVRLASDPVPPRAAASAQKPRRGWWLAAPIALALIAVILVAMWLRTPPRAPTASPAPVVATKIGLLPFSIRTATPAAAAFADALTDRIAGSLEDGQVPVLAANTGLASTPGDVAELGRRLGADLLVDGTVRSVGGKLEVQARLEDARERVTIWSATISGRDDRTDALAAQVAARVAFAAEWASVGRTGAVRLDAATLAAFIAGRENTTGVRAGGDAAALADYQQVTRAAPDFAWGHSAVAVTAAFTAVAATDPKEAASATDRARAEAARALALDPHNGEAYLALQLALPRPAWAERDRLLRKGAEVDPAFGPVMLMEGRLLWQTGRLHEALDWLGRANGLDPLHGGATWSLAIAYAAYGFRDDTAKLARQMHREWPDLGWTHTVDFTVAVAANDDRAALAALAAYDWELDDFRTVWRTALTAAISGDPAAKRRAADAVLTGYQGEAISVDDAVYLLVKLGKVERALPLVPRMPFRSSWRLPVLFVPATAPLRADPRFIRAAHALGLTAFWRASGVWPDFCADPHLPYDCRVEAAKAEAGTPAPAPRVTSH